MKFSEWLARVQQLEALVGVAESNLETVTNQRDEFLKGTTGFAARDFVSLKGMALLIGKVLDMRKEEDL